MFGLKGRRDGFRLLLPKEFICDEITEKYTKVLREKNSYYHTPIDFVNETIQSVQVLGFTNAVVEQQQTNRGEPLIYDSRDRENNFRYPSTNYNYRAADTPLNLMDKTLNITFRHTLGYINYFILFENFWYQFSRDRKYKDLVDQFSVDIINERGEIYSRIVLYDPLLNGMDMLDLDYTAPVAQSDTFKLEFKYSNFDFEFIKLKDPAPNKEIGLIRS